MNLPLCHHFDHLCTRPQGAANSSGLIPQCDLKGYYVRVICFGFKKTLVLLYAPALHHSDLSLYCYTVPGVYTL